MNYLSVRSINNLQKVYPPLVAAVCHAIQTSTVDFMVFEGVRSPATQRLMYESGASQTLESLHLLQDDGFAHAVDLVPYVPGSGLRWEHDLCFPVAKAMSEAGKVFDLRTRWGGAWMFDDFSQETADPRTLQQTYIQRRLEIVKETDEPPLIFLDSVHFEVPI